MFLVSGAGRLMLAAGSRFFPYIAIENRMTAHTLSAADVRGVGLSDYSTRLVLNDPSLSPDIRFGPKGGGGTRFFTLRHLLPILRTLPKFTHDMQTKLAALDQKRRAKGQT